MNDRAAPAAAGQRVWRGSGRLADGREIIYYDESPGSGRVSVPDTRDLTAEERPVPGPESGLRWDPLTGEWVIVAAQRQGRTFLPPAEHCPLDPSRPGRPTEIPAPDYDVVVFENRFPSLYGATAPGEAAPAGQNGSRASAVGWAAAKPGQDGLISTARPAFGRCEVVCFTAEHEGSFADLPPRRVRTVLEAWADRSAALAAMPGIAQVFCFENRGEEIGVTLHHPHGQIYAYPYVTPTTTRYLQACRRAGTNLYRELLQRELDGERVVASNDLWTAFVPYAARWPFEIHLAPHRQAGDLSELTDAERDAGAVLWLELTQRLDGLFDLPMPYVAAWHQAPVRADRDLSWLHLRIHSIRRAPGKLKYLAGSESAMGAWVNDIAPETAALLIRNSSVFPEQQCLPRTAR
jgi:UDPglucose--hexose-1-phosphate uridylyltransferase